MSLNRLTIAEARDKLRAREIHRRRTDRGLPDRHRRRRGAERLRPPDARDRPRPGQSRRRPARGGRGAGALRHPAGDQGPVLHRGRPQPGRVEHPEGVPPGIRIDRHPQLFDAGAVMLGKLNMDEFAMGSSNETSCYGAVVNPWRRGNDDDALTPGGSSGGSAAAVAADLCLGAIGTDTGGSIRQPAAFTGITGIKPTYGRCSRWGIVAFASSLDQAGPMAKSVRDAAILLRAMAGHDPKDSTSADLPVPDFEAMLTGDIRGSVIGIPREYRMDGMPDEIEALWADGTRDAGGCRRRASATSRCRIPNTRCRPTTSSPRPRRRRTSPVMTASATATGPTGAGRRHHRDVREDPRRGLRRRGEAPGDDRHLRAVGRLLRRLLQPARKVRALIKRDFETPSPPASTRS